MYLYRVYVNSKKINDRIYAEKNRKEACKAIRRHKAGLIGYNTQYKIKKVAMCTYRLCGTLDRWSAIQPAIPYYVHCGYRIKRSLAGMGKVRRTKKDCCVVYGVTCYRAKKG